MNNIMLDLETMGNTDNSAIIAIGAVAFDPATRAISPQDFYVTVDLEDAVRHGGVIDPSTVMWWMKQSDEARSKFSIPGVQLEFALANFSLWLTSHCSPDAAIVWGNGAAFDNVILKNAYQSIGIAAPWKFWNDRCYRTIKALNPEVKMNRSGVHHCAVDDARSQAMHLMDILNPATPSFEQLTQGV